MSDPAKSTEIEDVLSSIRRLVNGGENSAQATEAGEEEISSPEDDAVAADEDAAQALVLTPAQRVEMPHTNPPEAAQMWEADAVADAAEAPDEVVVETDDAPAPMAFDVEDATEDAVAVVEVPELAIPDEDAAETGGLTVSGDLEEAEADPTDEAIETDEAEVDEYTTTAAPTVIVSQSEPAAQSAAQNPPPRQGFGFAGFTRNDPAAHVPRVAVAGDAAAPAHAVTEAPQSDLASVQALPNAPESAPEPVVEQEVASEVPAPDLSGPNVVSGRKSPLFGNATGPFVRTEDPIARGQAGPADAAAAVTPTEPTLPSVEDEPLAAETEVDAATAEPVHSEVAEAQTDEAPTIDAMTDTAAVLSGAETEASLSGNLFSDLGSIQDEAALRAIIVDTVHRELQGALGARMTRNIKALIRAEVARAIAEARED